MSIDPNMRENVHGNATVLSEYLYASAVVACSVDTSLKKVAELGSTAELELRAIPNPQWQLATIWGTAFELEL